MGQGVGWWVGGGFGQSAGSGLLVAAVLGRKTDSFRRPESAIFLLLYGAQVKKYTPSETELLFVLFNEQGSNLAGRARAFSLPSPCLAGWSGRAGKEVPPRTQAPSAEGLNLGKLPMPPRFANLVGLFVCVLCHRVISNLAVTL